MEYHADRAELETHPMAPRMNERFVTIRREIVTPRWRYAKKGSHSQSGRFAPAPSRVERSSLSVRRRWPVPGLCSCTLEVIWAAG